MKNNKLLTDYWSRTKDNPK